MPTARAPVHALILSGGGALGAYEAAAAAKIFEHHEHTDEPVRIVSGSSVGALNAAMLAQRDPRGLMRLWRTIERKHVLGGARLGKLSLAWRLARGKPLYDVRPLQRLIRANVRPDRLRDSGVHLQVHATDLNRRRLVTWTGGSPGIHDGILASASLPLVFPQVHYRQLELVDGGVVANTPIRSAIDAGATRLTIVYLDDERVTGRSSVEDALQEPMVLPDRLSPVRAAQRSLETLMASHLERDLKLLDLINLLVDSHGDAVPQYRHVRWRILQPRRPLAPPGSTLNFDREFLDGLIRRGTRDALRFLGGGG